MPSLQVGADTVNFVLPGSAPTYPYPIVKYAPIAGETLAHFFAKQPVNCIVDMGGQTATFSDFAQAAWNRSATDNGGWGILGGKVLGIMGKGKFSMIPNSSTKAALVNALKSGQTANYQLMRLGIGANPNVLLPSFFVGEIDGTVQGHQYTGMQSYLTDHSVFGPFLLRGIQSNQAASVDGPPGETFAWGSYHDTNPTFTDFEIDGQGVTCSGIGVGPQDNGGVYNYTRGYIHDVFGGAITHYDVTNAVMNFTDMHLSAGGTGLNFERCTGTANIIRPNFDNCRRDIIADSDLGFLNINIVDPILTAAHPKVVIVVHKTYDYPPRHPDTTPNKQFDAATNNHVTLTVAGKSRPDLISFVTS